MVASADAAVPRFRRTKARMASASKACRAGHSKTYDHRSLAIMRDKFSRLASILIIALCLAWAVPCCHAQQGKKPFTIADDVGLTAFGNRTAQQAIRFSPEGSYLAVLTVRGRL